MKIIDTTPQLLCRFQDSDFRMDIWDGYANAISPSLREKCKLDAAEYAPEDIHSVAKHALSHREQIRMTSEAFRSITLNLEKKAREVLKSDIDVVIILYLGLCNAAGWATELDGRPAILLGIEKIIELNWCSERTMTGLVYHELGHLWHFQRRTSPWFKKANPALWQLYSEGVAMYCEQELAGDPEFMPQYDAAWKCWCRNNRPALFSEYLRRLNARESVQDFFGDWSAYQGHSDVGYELGSVLIRQLSKEMDTQALLDLGEERIYDALVQMSQTTP